MNTLPATRISESRDGYTLTAWTGGFVRFNHSPTNHRHLHETYHELCLVLEGHGRFVHGDEEFALSPGTLFLSELNTVHEISSHRSRNLYLAFCSFALAPGPKSGVLESAEEGIVRGFLTYHQLVARDKQQLADYLSLMAGPGDATQDHLRRHTALRLFVLDGLASLSTPTPHSTTLRTPDPIAKAIDYIERNLRTPFSIAQLAKACFCSERHLRRLFKERTGRCILDTINERRMQLAAQQLLMRFGVSEVAESFGMSSVAHFSRLFKHHHGVSPKRYQMAHAPGPTVPRTLFRP